MQQVRRVRGSRPMHALLRRVIAVDWGMVVSLSAENRGMYALAILDILRLHWRQLLELSTLSVGQFQRRPETVRAICAVLSVPCIVIVAQSIRVTLFVCKL